MFFADYLEGMNLKFDIVWNMVKELDSVVIE